MATLAAPIAQERKCSTDPTKSIVNMARRRTLMQPMTKQLEPGEAHEYILNLERRIALCEKLVGPYKKPVAIQNNAKVSKDWQNEVNSKLNSNIATQIHQVHKMTQDVIRNNLSDFDSKYHTLHDWMAGENMGLTNSILTIQAKRTFVLERENHLRKAVTHLKRVHEMKEFVNPPKIPDMQQLSDRLKKVEARGHQLAEEALRLQDDVHATARKYNALMNALALWLKECDKKIIATRLGSTRLVKRVRQQAAFEVANSSSDED